MSTPRGKKNLQTYIKTLQAKQNFVDRETKIALSEQKRDLFSHQEQEDDPRLLSDL
jgi:hypothetical protein